MNSAYLEAVIKELRDELDTIQQTIDGLGCSQPGRVEAVADCRRG